MMLFQPARVIQPWYELDSSAVSAVSFEKSGRFLSLVADDNLSRQQEWKAEWRAGLSPRKQIKSTQ